MAIDNPYGYTDNLVEDVYDDQYEVIDMAKQTPLNDPDCKHQFKLDGDEIGDMVGWSCIHCHRGKFYPKGVTIINT